MLGIEIDGIIRLSLVSVDGKKRNSKMILHFYFSLAGTKQNQQPQKQNKQQKNGRYSRKVGERRVPKTCSSV